ncbi:MAG TPA: alpha-L-rhamnosidase C-terminal domain-containing protein [Armatimonadota bacterium]
MTIHDYPYPELEKGRNWLARGKWPCSWVRCPEVGDLPFVTAYRRRFTLPQDTTLRVHVTADERYELYLDGERVGRGSDRGDAENWFFETYDLPMKAGEHVLVARVWSLGGQAPYAQMTLRPGFLLSPQERAHDALVGTGVAEWEAKKLGGYAFTDPSPAWGTGARLVLDGGKMDWGFERGEGDGWRKAEASEGGADAVRRAEFDHEHLLRPSTLPAMMEEPRRLGRVRLVTAPDSAKTADVPYRAADDHPQEREAWQRLFRGGVPLTIPPHTRRRVLLDLDNYVCAYPEVTVSGGKGSQVRVCWAESLYDDPRSGSKGNRDEVEGKRFITIWHLKEGVGDTYLPDGGDHRLFETLWWECGRYVEVYVETADEPLKLVDFRLRETHYPMELESRFESSDERLEKLIPLAFRTIQMCAHETYMDCPYYEQLMYSGDTRLQCLVTYIAARDDRLPRKALWMLNESRLNTGLTQSRYPSRVRQLIPPFSLWWIAMVHDYGMWRDDPAFVRHLMPGVRAVIDHFEGLLNEQGMVQAPKGWNTLDWVPGWRDGVPPEGYDGVSGLINWQFVWSLVLASEVETSLGEKELSERDRRLARELGARLERALWDEKRGLMADDLAHKQFSEHTQCLWMLSGVGSKPHLKRAFQSLLTDANLARTTIYFRHYLFEVLAQHGRADELLKRLDLWHGLLERGLRTTIEMPEPTRSDCHAWGAHPLFHYHASLLGVRPAEPGFRSVSVTPCFGPLTSLSGTTPHPKGEVMVDLRRDGDRLTGRISLPPGVKSTLHWGTTSIPLKPGEQEVEEVQR